MKTRSELLRVIAHLDSTRRLFGNLTNDQTTQLNEAKQELISLGPNGGYEATVTTMSEFREKYGPRLPGLLIEQFIEKCPEFSGKFALATNLAILVADLESIR